MKKAFLTCAAAIFLLLLCSSKSESTKKLHLSASAKATIKKAQSDIWKYSDNFDPVTSKHRFYASIIADEKLKFDFPYEGGSTATLTVRNTGNGNEVMLTISKGQFLTGDDHLVSVRTDANKVITLKASAPSDGSSDVVFLEPAGKLIKAIKTSKIILLQVEFFQGGTRNLNFEVDGLNWDH